MNATPMQLVDVLLDHQVPFVIIGGHAVNYHGHARATEDMDIVYRKSDESILLLTKALESVNAFWISDEIDPTTRIEKAVPVDLTYVQSKSLMMLGTDLGYLDVFDFVPGLPGTPVDAIFEDAIQAEGRPYISLSKLRQLKLASGRPIDLSDLEKLPSI